MVVHLFNIYEMEFGIWTYIVIDVMTTYNEKDKRYYDEECNFNVQS